MRASLGVWICIQLLSTWRRSLSRWGPGCPDLEDVDRDAFRWLLPGHGQQKVEDDAQASGGRCAIHVRRGSLRRGSQVGKASGPFLGPGGTGHTQRKAWPGAEMPKGLNSSRVTESQFRTADGAAWRLKPSTGTPTQHCQAPAHEWK